MIGCIELVSCATGSPPADILTPAPISGIIGSTGRISIERFSEKEIVFNIRISLGRAMWLEYIILDEEGNSVSEESFYHDVRRAYTRKMKAKEEFKFQEGVNYTLHIGYKWTVPHPYYGHFQLFFSYKFML